MNINDEHRSMKIVPFNGDEEKWPMWSERKKDKYQLYDLIDTIDPEMTNPADDEQKLSSEQMILKQKNNLVFADLVVSINDKVLFGILISTKNNRTKNGDANREWKEICEKFDRKTKTSNFVCQS